MIEGMQPRGTTETPPQTRQTTAAATMTHRGVRHTSSLTRSTSSCTVYSRHPWLLHLCQSRTPARALSLSLSLSSSPCLMVCLFLSDRLPCPAASHSVAHSFRCLPHHAPSHHATTHTHVLSRPTLDCQGTRCRATQTPLHPGPSSSAYNEKANSTSSLQSRCGASWVCLQSTTQRRPGP
jgi:hypothetical protein